MYVAGCTCTTEPCVEVQGQPAGNLFSPSTTWAAGTELRWASLVAKYLYPLSHLAGPDLSVRKPIF